MPRLRLPTWWKRQSAEELRWTLAKYEEEAEAHHQAAETARNVGSEAAYAHQMELAAWYEQEAEKVRQKLARRGRKRSH